VVQLRLRYLPAPILLDARVHSERACRHTTTAGVTTTDVTTTAGVTTISLATTSRATRACGATCTRASGVGVTTSLGVLALAFTL
jgi:hypothetical protein